MELDIESVRQKYLEHVIGEWQTFDVIGRSGARAPGHGTMLEALFVPRRLARLDDVRWKSVVVDGSPAQLWKSAREQMQRRGGRAQPITLAEALNESSRIVLLGAAGAGKSTLLQYLALACARVMHDGVAAESKDAPLQEPRLPLHVTLRAFARERSERGPDYALADYLHDQYRARGQDFRPPFFRQFIEGGECILLLDGLDEVATKAQRMDMRDWIEGVARAHAGNRIVVASRPQHDGSAPLDRYAFQPFALLDFDDERIHRFAVNWYRAVEHRDEQATTAGAQHLSEAVMRNPGVKRLAANPLLLNLLAALHAGRPRQRVNLYDELVKASLARRGPGKPPLDEEEQKRCLEQIAHWMHTQQLSAVARDALQRQVTAFLKERRYAHADAKAKNLIDELDERAGLLVAAEGDRERLAFAHHTFQDYFLAMDIVYRARKDKDQQLIHDSVMERLHDPRWAEAGLFAAAKLKLRPATRLVEAILNAHSWGEDVLHRDLFFAARLLADDVMAEPAVAERVCAEMAHELWRTHPKGELECDGALHESLGAMLKHLAQSVHRETLGAVLRQRMEDQPAVECASGYHTLALIDPQRLAELARTAEKNRVRLHAAKALGQVGERAQAAQLLLDLARTARGDYIRWAAAEALAQWGEKSLAAEPLLSLARTSRHKQARRHAFESLGRWGERSEAISHDLEALARTDTDADIRQRAASTLAHLGEQAQAIPLLLELARTAPDERVRANSAKALGWLDAGAEAAIDGLSDLARTADSDAVRLSALEALVRLSQPSTLAVNVLSELARTAPNERARWLAARTLGQWAEGREVAISSLAELARAAQNEALRVKALGALWPLGEQSAAHRESLLELARTASDAEVRRSAAETLAHMGVQSEATQLLLDLARTASDAGVRWRAVHALGMLPDQSQSVLDEVLAVAQHDSDADVRDAAYGALQLLTDEG